MTGWNTWLAEAAIDAADDVLNQVGIYLTPVELDLMSALLGTLLQTHEISNQTRALIQRRMAECGAGKETDDPR